MKICPNCHTSYENEARFCANCGIPLTEFYQEASPVPPYGIVENEASTVVPEVEQALPNPPETAAPQAPVPPAYPAEQAGQVPEAVYPAEPAGQTSGAVREEVRAEATPEQPPKKKSFLKKLIPLAALLALVVLGIFFLPKLLGGSGSGGSKPYNYVYSSSKHGVYGINEKGQVLAAPAVVEEANIFGEQGFGYYTRYFYTSDKDSRTLWEYTGESFNQVAEQVKQLRFSLSGAVAYLNESENLYVYDGKETQFVAGSVKYLSCISPDGKAVGYVTENNNGDKYGYCSIFGKSKVYDLDKNNIPVAISNGGDYIYFCNASDNLYVQKGGDNSGAEKLSSNPSRLVFNADGTQALLQADGNLYFCEKLGREKISMIGYPIRVQGTNYQNYYPSNGYPNVYFFNMESLKQQPYYYDGSIYYLDNKLETRTVVKNVDDAMIVDEKTMLYSKNDDLFVINPSQADSMSEKLVDEVDNWVFNTESRKVFYVSDGESFVMKIGDKAQRVVQEDISIVYPLQKGFVYIRDDMAYYTEGERGTKITGLVDSVSLEVRSPRWILFYDEDGTYYLTTDGKTARKVWD